MQNSIIRPRLNRRLIRQFTPIRVIPRGPEVNPWFFANICDMVQKWGINEELRFRGPDGYHRIDSRVYYVPGERIIQASFSHQGRPLLTVVELAEKNFEFIRFECRHSVVLWDSDLSFDAAEEQIERLHLTLDPVQLISPRTKKRLNFFKRLTQIKNKRRQNFQPQISQFTPKSLPESLAGLTPELIADIHDLLIKFGYEDVEQEGIVFSYFDPEDGSDQISFGHCDDVTPRQVEKGTMIDISFCTCHNHLSIVSSHSEDDDLIEIPIESEAIGVLTWDPYLEIENIEDIIENVDLSTIISGRTDKHSCVRNPCRTIVQLTEFFVDEMFSYRNNIITANELNYDDPDDVILALDHPDEVRFIFHDLVGFIMMHRNSSINPDHYLNAMEKVYHSHGILTREDAFDMIDNQVKRDDLEKEIQEVLEKYRTN